MGFAEFSEFPPCPELGAQETIDSIQKATISPNLGRQRGLKATVCVLRRT